MFGASSELASVMEFGFNRLHLVNVKYNRHHRRQVRAVSVTCSRSSWLSVAGSCPPVGSSFTDEDAGHDGSLMDVESLTLTVAGSTWSTGALSQAVTSDIVVQGALWNTTRYALRFKMRKSQDVKLTDPLSPVYTIQPVVKQENWFDNRLYRVYKHSTGCQTRLTTGLTNGCIVHTNIQWQPVYNRFEFCLHDTARCQTGCTTGLTTGCIV